MVDVCSYTTQKKMVPVQVCEYVQKVEPYTVTVQVCKPYEVAYKVQFCECVPVQEKSHGPGQRMRAGHDQAQDPGDHVQVRDPNRHRDGPVRRRAAAAAAVTPLAAAGVAAATNGELLTCPARNRIRPGAGRGASPPCARFISFPRAESQRCRQVAAADGPQGQDVAGQPDAIEHQRHRHAAERLRRRSTRSASRTSPREESPAAAESNKRSTTAAPSAWSHIWPTRFMRNCTSIISTANPITRQRRLPRADSHIVAPETAKIRPPTSTTPGPKRAGSIRSRSARCDRVSFETARSARVLASRWTESLNLPNVKRSTYADRAGSCVRLPAPEWGHQRRRARCRPTGQAQRGNGDQVHDQARPAPAVHGRPAGPAAAPWCRDRVRRRWPRPPGRWPRCRRQRQHERMDVADGHHVHGVVECDSRRRSGCGRTCARAFEDRPSSTSRGRSGRPCRPGMKNGASGRGCAR